MQNNDQGILLTETTRLGKPLSNSLVDAHVQLTNPNVIHSQPLPRNDETSGLCNLLQRPVMLKGFQCCESPGPTGGDLSGSLGNSMGPQ